MKTTFLIFAVISSVMSFSNTIYIDVPLKVESALSGHLVPTTDDIKAYIIEEAEKNGINPDMATFIAFHESSFNMFAVGDTHLICKITGEPIRSRGIWQINNCAHPNVSDATAFSVEKSTEWAMQYLKTHPFWWTTYRWWLARN